MKKRAITSLKSQKNIKEIIEKVQIMSPIKILKTESKKVAE